MCVFKIVNLVKTCSVKNESSIDSDITVIQDVSIEIKKGEMLGIIGKSGCGKTTLLKIMGGMSAPTTCRC